MAFSIMRDLYMAQEEEIAGVAKYTEMGMAHKASNKKAQADILFAMAEDELKHAKNIEKLIAMSIQDAKASPDYAENECKEMGVIHDFMTVLYAGKIADAQTKLKVARE